MQNGSLSKEQRERIMDVWCYRWLESGPTGRRIHRRIILGTVEQLHDKRAANQATVGLRREINSHDIRTKTTLMTVAELADHFRQRELLDSNMRITYSTKKAYADYLTKWIVPRWGQNALQHIKAREVELWLASVQRARTTRAKIRNVMSVYSTMHAGTLSSRATLSNGCPNGGTTRLELATSAVTGPDVTVCNFTAPIATLGALRNSREVLLHPS